MRRRLVLAVLTAIIGACALVVFATTQVSGAGRTFDLIDATETLVIERQEGRLVWGVDEYTQDDQLIRTPVRGAIDADGRGFAIAEENGFFLGEILGPNRVRVRFVRSDDQFTSFDVVLRRG